MVRRLQIPYEVIYIIFLGNDEGYVKQPLFPGPKFIFPSKRILLISKDISASWVFSILPHTCTMPLQVVAFDQNVICSRTIPNIRGSQVMPTICLHTLLVSLPLEDLPNLVLERDFVCVLLLYGLRSNAICSVNLLFSGFWAQELLMLFQRVLQSWKAVLLCLPILPTYCLWEWWLASLKIQFIWGFFLQKHLVVLIGANFLWNCLNHLFMLGCTPKAMSACPSSNACTWLETDSAGCASLFAYNHYSLTSCCWRKAFVLHNFPADLCPPTCCSHNSWCVFYLAHWSATCSLSKCWPCSVYHIWREILGKGVVLV